MGYDYNTLIHDANQLVKKHEFIDMYSIGESVIGNKIYCLKIGSGENKIFINGAHHGLESLTSAFIMKFLSEYSDALSSGHDFFGNIPDNLFKSCSLYAVPMVNPDGVDIAIHGIDISNPYHRKLISITGIHNFKAVWQANANGVDINHNYDADWQPVEPSPAPSKYSGPYPESEPETKAITEFIRHKSFDMLIAFHSQGKEIYYDFGKKTPKNSYKIAKMLSEASGYDISKPTGSASFGGCKDWFIDKFEKPGFTVEIGIGENPLPDEMLPYIYEENAKIILTAMNYIIRRNQTL